MNQFKPLKWIGIAAGVATLAFMILFPLSFKPVDTSEFNSKAFTGTLASYVQDTSTFDVAVRLDGVKNRFYINRAEGRTDVLAGLDTLRGKPVTVWAAKYWSLFFPRSNYTHVTRIATGDGRIVYTEW